ncbi:hypothetical protein AO411_2025495 [Salmonella enterica subsp. enterica serovar Sarajane]|nr:hypothetical protein AO411_2025495 [Salmonella enterica subsp. enterica serovar Sarajane]
MKKLMVALVMACSFLLTACGGDNGELAGTFKGSNGIMPEKWIIDYNKKDDQYIVTVFSMGVNLLKNTIKDLKKN